MLLPRNGKLRRHHYPTNKISGRDRMNVNKTPSHYLLVLFASPVLVRGLLSYSWVLTSYIQGKNYLGQYVILSHINGRYSLSLNVAMGFLRALSCAGTSTTGKFQWSIQVTLFLQSFQNCFMSCTLVLLLTRRLRKSMLALPVWNNGRFYTRGRIMLLDELGQTFVIRLVIRL